MRDDLTGEHVLGDAGQLISACVFAATWVIDTFFLNYSTFLNHHVPLAARISFGVVLIALSGYLAKKGMSIVFGERRTTPAVIRKSVYNVVRHPIYLSEIVLYLGFLCLSISIAATCVWIIAALFLYYISRCEEKMLLERFGEEYASYMRDVPMLIPRFRIK